MTLGQLAVIALALILIGYALGGKINPNLAVRVALVFFVAFMVAAATNLGLVAIAAFWFAAFFTGAFVNAWLAPRSS